jgi:hypothetical protein
VSGLVGSVADLLLLGGGDEVLNGQLSTPLLPMPHTANNAHQQLVTDGASTAHTPPESVEGDLMTFTDEHTL